MGRSGRSLLLVVVGVISVIGVSWLIGTLYIGVISFDSNAQILGRVSPRVIDLIAALASGAAGAFCMAREDISDSLPGVAISISLVPPLCVVGISLQTGQWDAAGGAFLLFFTNFLSILLAGGSVLALLGLSGAAMVKVTGTARRNAFLVIIASVLVVMVALWITGARISEDARTEGATKAIATRWVAGSGYEVRSVTANLDKVVVLITGSGALPVRDISAFGPLVFAKASNGVVLLPLPLDRAIWTERASERVPMAVSTFKAANPDTKKFHAWITGTASKMVKDQMAKFGGQVTENVDNRIGFVF